MATTPSKRKVTPEMKPMVSIVSDAEIRYIYYQAKSIADGGQTLVALVRRRLAERTPMIDVDEAEKAAHGACPCKIYADTIDGDACDARPCDCFVVDGNGDIRCKWPGHAAIHALRSAAESVTK